MIEIDNLISDPEFTNQLPSLDPEAFNKLEASILETGAVINPIVVWNGIIVDGHKRCDVIRQHKDHDIRYGIYEMNFPDRAAALAWMYENQLGQRNLTAYQKSYLLGKQYEAEKQSRGGTGANQYKKVQTGQNDQSAKEDNQTTAQRIAMEYGIGEKTVRRAESFARGMDLAEETVPGTRGEILAGKIRPSFQEIEELTVIEDPEERKKRIEGFHLDKKKEEKPENFAMLWETMIRLRRLRSKR